MEHRKLRVSTGLQFLCFNWLALIVLGVYSLVLFIKQAH